VTTRRGSSPKPIPWELDAKRREIIQKVEALRHKQRLAGEEIARKGKAKEDTSALKAEMKIGFGRHQGL
jgi:seryl-tRNA synthetase